MMAMSLMAFSMNAIENGSHIFRGDALAGGFKPLFDLHGFWFVMQLILLIDTLMFTVGYLVELPQLGNSIRSVDRTFLGWTAALLCYAPFNGLAGALLGSQRSDFPQFEDATAHLVLNCLLLTLMAVYASASVALGFKASNLTHRGIVARGPYALIRHPAYTCKNLAWWIGASPLVIEAFTRSTFEGIEAVASVAGWTSLYVLRALTEEDHLHSVDDEYAAYAGRVRFRFIPGVV
jgi:protein-S-isoprenylcysteine O-methyltransferase Ste14